MSKTLAFYRDAIRELRESGREAFSAGNGYYLRGELSSGQKGAISRALNQEHERASEREEPEEDEGGDSFEPSDYFDDGIDSGDWDDIDYFDYDEIDDFADEEADSYGEDASK